MTIVAGTSTAAIAGWFGPSNYEDCVLEKMKGVTSDVAAKEIKQACQSKFPTPVKEMSKEDERKWIESTRARPLTSVEISNIVRVETAISDASKYGFDKEDNDIFFGIYVRLNNQNPNVKIKSLKYRYKIGPKDNWSLVYEWNYAGSKGFAPYQTVGSTLENTNDLKKILKTLKASRGEKGEAFPLEILSGTSCSPLECF